MYRDADGINLVDFDRAKVHQLIQSSTTYGRKNLTLMKASKGIVLYDYESTYARG